MLEGIIAGEEDPKMLAGRVTTHLKASTAELNAALKGSIKDNQRWLLAQQLEHITFLDGQIAEFDTRIREQLVPFQEAIERLDTIPGVGERAAQEIVVTAGTDMSRFPSAAHFASWAGLCPGLHQSGGKRTSASVGQGHRPLREILVECAWAASHTKSTYLAAQYHRLAARKGSKRALVAVAHSIGRIAYHVLKDGEDYQDLGANYFDERSKDATIRRTLKRLERLGYPLPREAA